MLTIPFAVYGLFRYIYLVHGWNIGGEPEMIFRDKAMLINFALWLVAIVVTWLPEGVR